MDIEKSSKDNISKKEKYSDEEKQFILQKLNNERLKHQQEEEKLHIANIAKNETYSDEEKEFILDRLNNERLKQQIKEKEKTSTYSKEEKENIFEKLNAQRLEKQKIEEMKKRRLNAKRKYTFINTEYYKILGMRRPYFIEVDFCKSYSGRTMIATIYYEYFSELKKKDVLIRTDIDSESLFISFDAIRLYFKPYSLEHE